MGGFGAIQLGSFAPQDAASCATVAAHDLSLSLFRSLSLSLSLPLPPQYAAYE